MSLGCSCPLRGLVEVPYRGDVHADIVFIGESPGNQEIKQRSPFVGPSGKLLVETIERVGLDPSKVFYANSTRCKLEKDVLAARQIKQALDACRPNLTLALREIRPKVIVLLGAYALQTVLNIKGVKKSRGIFKHSSEFNCHIMPTWHPAYILRNQSEKGNFEIDLAKVARLASNDFVLENTAAEFKWHEVESIQPLLDGGLMKESQSLNPAAFKKDVRVIRTPVQEDHSPFVTAVDTETQGLNWYDPNSIVISYSIAVSPVEGWTIYFHEEVRKDEGDFNITVQRGGTKKKPTYVEIGIKKVDGYDRRVAELKELCSREDIKIYFANQKYDRHRLHNLGITKLANAPMDVMLAAHALDSERYLNNTLSQLVESFTDMSYNYKDDLTETEKGDMLLTVWQKRNQVNRYACFDAVATLNVAIAIKKALMNDITTMNYYVHFLHPAETGFLYWLERNGVLVDTKKLPEVKQGIMNTLSKSVAAFRRLCPPPVVNRHNENFVLTRRIILMEALFDYTAPNKDGVDERHNYGYGITPLHYSPKSRMPVCDKDVMSRVLENPTTPDRAKELIHLYREWSDYYTLLTRYIKNIENCIGPKGRMHPTYSFKFTSSGRTGARNPSIQNFPKRGPTAPLIRSLIISPRRKKLMEADYSMSELRWVAHVARERKMKEIFGGGGDIHLTTGLEVSGYSQEQIDELDAKAIKKIRQNAKAVNFGLIYGMSAPKLRLYARSSYGLKLSPKDAESWRNKFFDLYRDLTLWHSEARSEILTNGYIRHVFGRKRNLPNVNSPDRMTQAEAIRIGTNFVIQGPSSDATLMGGMNIINNPEYSPKEARPTMFIHDALIFEVDEDKLEKYGAIIKDGMENIETRKYGFTLTVPLIVEAEQGNNLAEMKEMAI